MGQNLQSTLTSFPLRLCEHDVEEDLVNLFLLTREGEGKAQRKSLSLQAPRDEEVPKTGCDVVEQLWEAMKQRNNSGISFHLFFI